MSSDASSGKSLVVRLPKIPMGIVGELHTTLVQALRASVVIPGRQVVFSLAYVLGAMLSGLFCLTLDLVVPVTAAMSFFFIIAGGFASALYFSRVRIVRLLGSLTVPELDRIERAWYIYSSKQSALDIHVRQMRKDGSSQADIDRAVGQPRLQALNDYLAVLDSLQRSSPIVRGALESNVVQAMLPPGRDDDGATEG